MIAPRDPDFTKKYRSTMGVCLGFRAPLSSSVVVLSCGREDPARTLFVTYEWELLNLNVDDVAAAMAEARAVYRTANTCGYYGGRDDERIFKTMSIRLGQHVEPAPHDHLPPLKLMIDDLRSGRLKAKADSLVARDARTAVWREGTPDETGVLVALRCAHWAAQQYRQKVKKAPLTREQQTIANAKARHRRIGAPF